MKRLLLILLLLPLICCSQQIGFINTVPGSPAPGEDCGSPTVIGEIIRDDFNGASLSSNWTVRNSGSQTITVSGGRIRFQGGLTTKSDSLYMVYTNYLGQTNAYSTLSQYTVTLWDIRFNSIGSTTYGPICGVEPRANDANLAALFGNVDPSGTDQVSILQSDHQYIIGNSTNSSSSMPAINTSDSYNLSISMTDGEVELTFTNVTASTSKTITYSYSATTANPRIPPIFFYAMGVIGGTDYSCDAFTVSSTQLSGAKFTFVGNSITKGFSTGSFQDSYPYELRDNTACDIQVFAGPGITSTDAYVNRHEIAAYSADTVFLNLGTNDSPGGGSVPAALGLLVTHLEGEGKVVYLMEIGNGGDPATPGTFNYNLNDQFPGQVLATYQFWSVMIGNPTYMYDALHPNATGALYFSNGIKSLLPGSFPL